MKNLKALLRLLSLGVLLLQVGVTSAQIVNVSQTTGAATINIPIHTLTRGKITVPISLFYYGNGVRAKDIEGSAGMNWQLSAGGSITRELRDVPDDLADNSRGWLYNNNASKINNFRLQTMLIQAPVAMKVRISLIFQLISMIYQIRNRMYSI